MSFYPSSSCFCQNDIPYLVYCLLKQEIIFGIVYVQLEELHAQNTAMVKGLWERVRMLWDRVETTKEDRDFFQSQASGVSQRVIQSVSITAY